MLNSFAIFLITVLLTLKKWKLIEYIFDELEHIFEVQTAHNFLLIFSLSQTVFYFDISNTN